MHKNKHIGYIIEIRDNTEKHNYLGLMFNYADELKTQVDGKTAIITRADISSVQAMM
ncbi:MAG: hypothetical protein ACI4SF_00955 [Oscillospiraceae bacterium]